MGRTSLPENLERKRKAGQMEREEGRRRREEREERKEMERVIDKRGKMDRDVGQKSGE